MDLLVKNSAALVSDGTFLLSRNVVVVPFHQASEILMTFFRPAASDGTSRTAPEV